ncbi:Mur ligase family protein [Candidatus Bipolaricaulota bacterium]
MLRHEHRIAAGGRNFLRWPHEIVKLPLSSRGRQRLWIGLRFRAWPFSYPLATLYRRTLIRNTHVIGVIGSFGKTTTTRAVASVLEQSPTGIGLGNARGFVAEDIFRIRPTCPSAVVEAGIKHKGWMRRYARLLKPNSVVVTSIGTEHHKLLGSITEIRGEKAEMLRRLPASATAILNGDDPNVRWMACQTRAAVRTFGFAMDNDIRASNYRSDGLSGGQFDLHVDSQSHRVRTNLVGRHQVYSLLAAVAVSQVLHLDLEKSLLALEDLLPTRRRLWPLRLENGAGLLMDTYKAVFETVDAALDTLEEIPAPHKIVILGEIFEPPKSEDEIYRHLGRRVARVADAAVFIGEESAYSSLRAGAGTEGGAILSAQGSVREASRLVKGMLTPQSVVLLKGLGSLRLERIALQLAGEEVDCSRDSCKVAQTQECGTCPFLR